MLISFASDARHKPVFQWNMGFNLAIMEINRKIVNLNKSNKTITPWIAKTVHIPRKDGVHHVYERLMDGLHWDNELKDSCAKRLVSAAGRLLE